jgi:hypothetical protein
MEGNPRDTLPNVFQSFIFIDDLKKEQCWEKRSCEGVSAGYLLSFHHARAHIAD